MDEDIQVLRLPMALKKPDVKKDVLDEQLVSTRKGRYQKFLVKWKGKPVSESTWISASDLEPVWDFVKEFKNCF